MNGALQLKLTKLPFKPAVTLHSNRFFRTFGADKSRSLLLSIICTF